MHTRTPTAFVAVKKRSTLAVLAIATGLIATGFATYQETTRSGVLRFTEGDDYIFLERGTEAPADGYLFTPESVDAIIDGREWFESRIDVRDARIEALEQEVEHLRNAIELSDKLALAKDDQIDHLMSRARWASFEKWVFLGGGIAVAIAALANQ